MFAHAQFRKYNKVSSTPKRGNICCRNKMSLKKKNQKQNRKRKYVSAAMFLAIVFPHLRGPLYIRRNSWRVGKLDRRAFMGPL